MPSFTTAVLVGLCAFANPSIAGYALEDDYSPSNFFSMFDFFTAGDPTHGFVSYVDQGTAQQNGLIQQSGSSVYMGVDNTTVTSSGRQSVRLTSSKSYNHGLIVLDVAHMPVGCGTWPAFWTTGPDWPSQGEIDIIEGVNDQSSNSMTLHTGPGCSITNNGGFSGSIATSNCDINAAGQSQNQGCGIAANNDETYGEGLNNIGGGVYATEWTSSAISVWFFPRSSIPSDISSGSPNPSGWGTPLSMFQGGCDIDSAFKNQQIVFDTTFCGDWAGNVWGQSATCSSKASSCQDYVANNPEAFTDAYWSINSLKVFQNDGSSSDAPVPATPASSSAIAAPVVLPTSTVAAPVQVTVAPSAWNGQEWGSGATPVTSSAAAAAPSESAWNGQPWGGNAHAAAPSSSAAPAASAWNGQEWAGPSQAAQATPSAWNGQEWVEAAQASAAAAPQGETLNWNDYNLSGGSRRAKRHARHLVRHQKRSL